MYKDDLQAAQARADASETRANRAEDESQRNKQRDKPHLDVMRPIIFTLGWLWNKRGIIFLTVIIVLFPLSMGWAIYRSGKRVTQYITYQNCIRNYCHKKCKKDSNGVISSWKWVHEHSVLSCKCHLKQGEKLFHFRVPEKCDVLRKFK